MPVGIVVCPCEGRTEGKPEGFVLGFRDGMTVASEGLPSGMPLIPETLGIMDTSGGTLGLARRSPTDGSALPITLGAFELSESLDDGEAVVIVGPTVTVPMSRVVGRNDDEGLIDNVGRTDSEGLIEEDGLMEDEGFESNESPSDTPVEVAGSRLALSKWAGRKGPDG